MSLRTELKWPIIDTEAVCGLQSRTGAGVLDLTTGALYNIQIPNQISFIDNGFIRAASVTTGGTTASGINFIINGLQNGAFVTDTIAGPSANTTVYGTIYFDIITSVTVTGTVTDVSVGTGKTGYLPLIQLNTLNTNSYINYSGSVVLNETGITYSLLETLENVSNNWIPLQNQSSVFFPSLGFTNETTNQIGNSTNIVNYLLLNVTASTSPTTNTLNFILIQA